MGSTKQTTETKTTPTEEERQLNARNLRVALATEEPQQQAQLSGLSLVNQLLTGTSPLPGFFGTMAEGITPDTIGNEATRLALRAMPQFQQLGLMESGTAAKQISRSIANELLYPAQQFNVGALQNMLNLALSGQAQVQQPIQAGIGQLGGQLAGLRTTTQTQTKNPFLESLYGSLGQSLGQAPFKKFGLA